MAILPQRFLFCWRDVEVASDLDRLRLVLAVLPDEPLMKCLEARRGPHGRDDYPVRACFNALVAGIVFQHICAAHLLRELMRNAELRDLCGFDPLRGADAVPPDWAFSRFLQSVIEEQEMLLAMFHTLVEQLRAELPDLGAKLAVDSKAVPSFGHEVRDEEQRAQGDRRRENDAEWGTKTYRGVREDGSAWTKVTHWFGFKLHLLVDSAHELPLAFAVTTASEADTTHLIPLVEDVEAHHPELLEEASRACGAKPELAADRGYDSAANNQTLYETHAILPVIDSRRLWKQGEGAGEPDGESAPVQPGEQATKTRVLCPQRADVFEYDEGGQVFCRCPATGERRALAYHGFEADRACQKFRCPAAAYGVDCRGRAECEQLAPQGVGEYGRTVRVPLDLDRRIFTPLARCSYAWQTAYNRRTAVERVNSRLDTLLGFEQHTIRGLAKMETRLTLALVVMLAMALGRIRAGQREQMRSLVGKAPSAREQRLVFAKVA